MRRLLAGLVAAFVLLVPGTAAAQGIQLRTDPEGDPLGPDAPLKLSVAQGSTDAASTIYLSTSEATSDVSLSAPLENGGQVTFTPAGGNEGDPFTVPAGDQRIEILVKATNPTDGDSGPLYAVVGGTYRKLATVQVERPEARVLSIEDSANNTLTLNTATETLSQSIGILNDTSVPVDRVHLRVSSLTDPRGQPVPLTARIGNTDVDETRELTVPANGRLDVTLQAAGLDLAGEYDGQLTLTYPKHRLTVSLVVMRTRAVAAVTITNPPPDQVGTGLNGRGTAVFQILIEETEGRTITLPPPTVVVRREEGDATEAADYGTITVQPGPTTSGAPPNAGADVAPITVPGGGSAIAEVRVADIKGPGKFTVEVRWPGGTGSKLATGTASLGMKWGWSLLAFIPAILLAGALRYLYTKLAPRLASKRALLAAADRFEDIVAATPPSGAQVADVITVIRDRIQASLDGAADATPTTTLRDELAVKLRLLPRWLKANADLRDLAHPPDVARDNLERVGDWLRSDNATPDEAVQWLAAAEFVIRHAPRIEAAIDELDAARVDWEEAPHPSPGSDNNKATAESKIDEARQDLAEGKLTEASESLRAAAVAFLSGVAEELHTLSAEEALPGADPEDWAAMQSELTQLIVRARSADEHPAAAAAAYARGYRRYLAARIGALRAALDALDPPPSALDRASIEGELRAAETSLRADDVAGAHRSEREATKRYNGLQGAQPQAAAPPSGAQLELSGMAPAAAAPSEPGSVWRRTYRWLTATQTVLTILGFITFGVLTALLGVTLLVTGNPTWGSGEDWLAAILWGLGLQAAGTGVFADPWALAGRLGGTGTGQQ